MKSKAKQKTYLPEVHILGDLKSVKRLIKSLNKKKTFVLFRDGETGSCHSEIDGKIRELSDKKIEKLVKNERVIFLDFFSGSKKSEPVVEELIAIEEPVKVTRKKKEKLIKPEPEEKPVRKTTRVKKADKDQKTI
jgi:hypothetical protein